MLMNSQVRNQERRNHMRTSCQSMVWLSVGLLAGFLPLTAVQGASSGDGAQGLYFCGGIGPEIAHKTDAKESFGPSSGIKVEYDPGLRISAAGGYQLCRYFSAGARSGILGHSLKSSSGTGPA